MKKINVKNGLQGRLIGSAIGGAASAVFDTYVTGYLPESMQDSPDIAKIVAGAFIPSVMKSDLGRSLGDGLMTVGLANFISSKLEETTDTTTTTTTTGSGVAGIGAGRINPFAAYAHRVRGIENSQRKIAGAGVGRSVRGC
ncbi:MAG: hypothetical protein LBS50_08685 [Prevotellaceae bacterium]|jgi:hypothetical protein|nr:hypothetical protein [Prevotellaceae bacterium]